MIGKISKVIAGLIALLFVVFIGYQIYLTNFSPIQIETVFLETVYRTIPTDGIVARDEVVLEDTKQGAVQYLVSNGSRVSHNAALASMYNSEQDIVNLNELERLQSELTVLEGAVDSASVQGVQLGSLDSQMENNGLEFQQDLLEGDLSNLEDIRNKYLGIFNRRQILLGSSPEIAARIETIRAEIAQLQGESAAPIATVTSGKSGYFVNTVDGYESALNLEQAGTPTYDVLMGWMQGGPSETGDTSHLVGKIVTSSVWRYSALIDKTEATSLRKGQKYQLQFSDYADTIIDMDLIYLEANASNDKAVVVFESDIVSEEITQLRLEKAQIIIENFEGVLVPKTALYVVDGEKGVYIKYGNEVRFRLVDVIYEEEEYLLSKENVSDSDYVRSYDQVIVKGVDLYDGKQIR